jgi:hypothetical protein
VKKVWIFILVAMLSLTVFAAASATAQETCPTGGGWTKVEEPDGTISGTTISFSIPEGYIVTDVCVKAGTTLYNWSGSAEDHFGWNVGGDHDVSHYSYKMIEAPPEPVTCARCSNIADFTWVEWTELDGDCTTAETPYEDRVETYPSELCGAIFGCTDEGAVNFDPDANFDDQSCVFECEETYEVEGLSSPGAWGEWEDFQQCRTIFTAIQHRDTTTDKICEVESRQVQECRYDLCKNLEGAQLEVPEGYIKLGDAELPGRCVPKPFNLKEVAVSVGLSCGPTADDGIQYQNYFGITIDPAGGATVTFRGEEYTESESGYAPFGSFGWSAVATEGYVIVGGSEGTVSNGAEDCDQDPKKVPPTGLGVGIREYMKAKREE